MVVDTNGNILDDAYEALKDLNILSLCGTSDTQKVIIKHPKIGRRYAIS